MFLNLHINVKEQYKNEQLYTAFMQHVLQRYYFTEQKPEYGV